MARVSLLNCVSDHITSLLKIVSWISILLSFSLQWPRRPYAICPCETLPISPVLLLDCSASAALACLLSFNRPGLLSPYTLTILFAWNVLLRVSAWLILSPVVSLSSNITFSGKLTLIALYNLLPDHFTYPHLFCFFVCFILCLSPSGHYRIHLF